MNGETKAVYVPEPVANNIKPINEAIRTKVISVNDLERVKKVEKLLEDGTTSEQRDAQINLLMEIIKLSLKNYLEKSDPAMLKPDFADILTSAFSKLLNENFDNVESPRHRALLKFIKFLVIQLNVGIGLRDMNDLNSLKIHLDIMKEDARDVLRDMCFEQKSLTTAELATDFELISLLERKFLEVFIKGMPNQVVV